MCCCRGLLRSLPQWCWRCCRETHPAGFCHGDWRLRCALTLTPRTSLRRALCHFLTLVQLLSGLTKDPDPEVRKVVCDSLTSLLDRAGEHMLPFLQPLTEFVLHTCQNDPNPEVVLSACEYWNVLCQAAAFEEDEVKEYYISLFPR